MAKRRLQGSPRWRSLGNREGVWGIHEISKFAVAEK